MKPSVLVALAIFCAVIVQIKCKKQAVKQVEKNASFQECLTSCVKSLKGSSDHSQLFACSSKCEEKSGLTKKMAKNPKGLKELLENSVNDLEGSETNEASLKPTEPPPPVVKLPPTTAPSTNAHNAPKFQKSSEPASESRSSPKHEKKPTVASEDEPVLPSMSGGSPLSEPEDTKIKMADIRSSQNSIFKVPLAGESDGSRRMSLHLDKAETTLPHVGNVKLHIGPAAGTKHSDWVTVDVRESVGADITLDARDLSSFANGTVAAIYASHILQLFHYRFEDQIVQTLQEWHRVLSPGGELFISVPDMPTLSWLYLNPHLGVNSRFKILQHMMGTQEHGHDVHHAAFDADLLTHYLALAGFLEFERVPELLIFDDTSSKKILDTFISLNMIARKSSLSNRY